MAGYIISIALSSVFALGLIFSLLYMLIHLGQLGWSVASALVFPLLFHFRVHHCTQSLWINKQSFSCKKRTVFNRFVFSTSFDIAIRHLKLGLAQWAHCPLPVTTTSVVLFYYFKLRASLSLKVLFCFSFGAALLLGLLIDIAQFGGSPNDKWQSTCDEHVKCRRHLFSLPPSDYNIISRIFPAKRQWSKLEKQCRRVEVCKYIRNFEKCWLLHLSVQLLS